MPSLERVWLTSQDECGSRLLVGRLQVHASPIFDVEFEACHRAQSLNRRRRQNYDKRLLRWTRLAADDARRRCGHEDE